MAMKTGLTKSQTKKIKKFNATGKVGKLSKKYAGKSKFV